MRNFLLYPIGALLLGFLIWKGIVPAFREVATDFPNYYTSARLYREGADLSRFYDDEWFARQIRDHGMPVEGKYSPFPPLTLFLMMPLTDFSPLNALRVWTLINILILAGIYALLRAIVDAPPALIAGIILSGGIGLVNNFRFGQWYLMLLLLMTLGYYFWKSGSVTSAGILFGLGAVFKYFPLLYIVLFLIRREWKGVFACGATFVLLNLLGVALLGVNMYSAFVQNVILHHVTANMQDPFSASFQSWPSFFRRIFVPDASLNPAPLIDWPDGLVIGTSVVATGVIISTFIPVIKLNKARRDDSLDRQVVLLTIMGLSLLPASATYHYVLLFLPMALLLSMREETPGLSFYAIFGLYVMMGFIPYHLFKGFDGSGILTIIAYPRLAIITAMLFLVIRHSKSMLLRPIPEHTVIQS